MANLGGPVIYQLERVCAIIVIISFEEIEPKQKKKRKKKEVKKDHYNK